MEEIFVPCVDAPTYSVSNFGRVMNRQNKIMSIGINSCGYVRVNLRYTPDHKKHFLLHRLVAKAFVPNPMGHPCVNHIDGNKINNCAYNLEWCTASGNMYHSFEVLDREVWNTRPVLMVDMFTRTILRRFASAHDAAMLTGINLSVICKYAKYHIVPHPLRRGGGGYIWVYEDEQGWEKA